MAVWLWVAFLVFVLGMLALDLGVLNRQARVISTRRAMAFSAFCAGCALAFTVLVYFIYEYRWLGIGGGTGPLDPQSGWDAAVMFLAGWIVEQSLSLDNIFVIAIIFGYFGVPLEHQHRTLFWGIVGALVMRLGMIVAGAALIARFHWIIYVFGALLLWTAWKVLRSNESHVHPDRNVFVRLARRFYPVTNEFHGEHFFAHVPLSTTTAAAKSGADSAALVWAATPLFLVLLVIESTDVIFAVDSIPAIFAITHDSFLVFTSNVFAILNLRSLYFALANMLDRFRLLKYSLVIILVYVGCKMLISDVVHFPAYITLIIIAISLVAGILASIWIPPKDPPSGEGAIDAAVREAVESAR